MEKKDSYMTQDSCVTYVPGDHSDDSYNNDSDDTSSMSSQMDFEFMDKKQQSIVTTISTNKLEFKTVIDLAKKVHKDILKFQSTLENSSYKFDYFKLWKYFEEKNYIMEEVSQMQKQPHRVKQFEDEKAADINECPKHLLGVEATDEYLCCDICFEDILKCDAKHLGCYHYFCESCFFDTIKENIESCKLWSEFRCQQTGCKKLMNYGFLQSLGIDKDERLGFLYSKPIGTAVIQGDPSIMSCKAKDCEIYVKLPYDLIDKESINEEKQRKIKRREDKLGHAIYKEKYPAEDHICDCCSPICIGCEDIGHEPAKCEDANKWRAKVESQVDKLTHDYIKLNTKPCFHCSVPTFKYDGCLHMTCTSCKGEWCFICGDNWDGYDKHRCKQEQLDRIETNQVKLEALKQEELNKYIDLYLQSSYRTSINIATAFNTNFEDFKKKNLEKKIFDSKTLERFFFSLKKAGKMCIMVRSFITWTYPIGFAMENNSLQKDFNKERQILTNFLEVQNYFTESTMIAAIFWSIDGNLFQQTKEDLAKNDQKNGLFSKDKSIILDELKKHKYDNAFQENKIVSLEQFSKSQDDKMDQQSKKYRCDEWYTKARISFNLE